MQESEKISQPFPFKRCFVYLQEIQCSTCVLLVITVMVCLAVTSIEGQDPDLVLYTLTDPSPEQAARLTACPALLAHTVTAQVWLSNSPYSPVITLTNVANPFLSKLKAFFFFILYSAPSLIWSVLCDGIWICFCKARSEKLSSEVVWGCVYANHYWI